MVIFIWNEWDGDDGPSLLMYHRRPTLKRSADLHFETSWSRDLLVTKHRRHGTGNFW